MMGPVRNRPESAAPGLLVAFFTATVAMVTALALLLRSGSDWADFVAVALLLAVAALVLIAVGRELAEEEPPAEDGSDVHRTGR